MKDDYKIAEINKSVETEIQKFESILKDEFGEDLILIAYKKD